MQRLFKIALLTFSACLGVLGFTALGIFLYIKRGNAPSRLDQLETRIKSLESGKQWFARSWQNSIATSDRKTDGGIFVLTDQADSRQEFHSWPPKMAKREVLSAWLSDWSPRSEILKFEEFRVLAYDHNKILILAKPKLNESISMDFWIEAIFEK